MNSVRRIFSREMAKLTGPGAAPMDRKEPSIPAEKKAGKPMRIIIDSREQCPFTFAHEKFGAEVQFGTLDTGDYSLAGLEGLVAVERKSLPDLIQCLGRERERFERELLRGAALDAFCVVIEGSWTDLSGGHYRSRLNPHSGCQSVAAFMARYRVPFFFAGSRAAGEYFVWSYLRQYLEGARKRYKAILKAHGDTAA